ncbi:MAG: hypothetical protein KBC95_02160 [Candidatus Peribacteraceae bacterium]|nr:hypothetical protein [Candidatus Peribacteraceae bacterium]
MGLLINAVSESAPTLEKGPANQALIVTQPRQLELLLGAIMEAGSKPSEKQGDASGDWSGGQGPAGGAADPAVTAREEALAAIPDVPVMQVRLEAHIEKEVESLRRQAVKLTASDRPGAAHELSELYAKIRRLNSLVSQLFDASIEVIKRLFIRVFIDKQSL